MAIIRSSVTVDLSQGGHCHLNFSIGVLRLPSTTNKSNIQRPLVGSPCPYDSAHLTPPLSCVSQWQKDVVRWWAISFEKWNRIRRSLRREVPVPRSCPARTPQAHWRRQSCWGRTPRSYPAAPFTWWRSRPESRSSPVPPIWWPTTASSIPTGSFHSLHLLCKRECSLSLFKTTV